MIMLHITSNIVCRPSHKGPGKVDSLLPRHHFHAVVELAYAIVRAESALSLFDVKGVWEEVVAKVLDMVLAMRRTW